MEHMDSGTLWEKRIRNAEIIAPNFAEIVGDLPKEYWDDWMTVLVEENRARLSQAEEDAFHYLSLESVEYIFTVCVRMRLPSEIRYLAALYFDKFMRKQTRSLFYFIASGTKRRTRKDEEWSKIESNVSRQIPLRVCSCIQLATKEFQYHTSLSTKDVVSMLRSLGHAYTLKAVAKSELRVVRTLNFTMPKSPVIYVESILKSLSRYTLEELGIDKEINMQLCWDHALLFMDMFFLYHERYAQILLRQIKPDVTLQNISSPSIACLKTDYALLGAGIVQAAVATVHCGEFAESILPRTSKLAQVSEEDVSEVCFALRKLALEDP